MTTSEQADLLHITLQEMEWRMEHGQRDKYHTLHEQITQKLQEIEQLQDEADELLNNEEIEQDENTLYIGNKPTQW